MKPIHIPTQFESGRLVIRAPRAGDGAVMNAAILDSAETLRPWMPWADPLPTLEQSEARAAQVEKAYAAGEDLQMLLFLKTSGELIGSSGIARMDWDVPCFELGYWCHAHHVGNGYISEAVHAITTFCFTQFNANRVEIRMDTNNVRSERIPQRLGFALEGTLRNDARSPNGDLRSTHIYALTNLSGLAPLPKPSA